MTISNTDFLIAKQDIVLDPNGDYGLSGNLKIKSEPRFRYFGGALKYGAANGTKKGKINVMVYNAKSGKSTVMGEILFPHEKYLPTILGKNAPEIVIYHELKRITESMMILKYPGNKVVIWGYLNRSERKRFLK